MSASLHWKPVPKPLEDDYLSKDLYFKIRGRFWPGGVNREVEVDEEFIPYLQGLADCNVEDAQKLIDLIREHDAVILELRF